MASAGSRPIEIAGFFQRDRGTLYKRFGVELRKGRAERVLKLREAQWKAFEAGNVRMLIWLGKQELGQSDKGVTQNTVERTESGPDEGPRAWELAAELDRELRRPGG